jgi:proteasome lid subunit RPN8/RPN11
VIVHRPVLDAVIAHARDEAPAECCGVLLGTPRAVTEARRSRNLAADPNRFLIDPKDHIDSRREARAAGLEVVGFYHSHPHSAPVPSATDLAEASYADCVYLIVGMAGERPDVRLYRFETGRFKAVDLEVA